MRIKPRTMEARNVRSAFGIGCFLEMLDICKVDKNINRCKQLIIVFVEKVLKFFTKLIQLENLILGAGQDFYVDNEDILYNLTVASSLLKVVGSIPR